MYNDCLVYSFIEKNKCIQFDMLGSPGYGFWQFLIPFKCMPFIVYCKGISLLRVYFYI